LGDVPGPRPHATSLAYTRPTELPPTSRGRGVAAAHGSGALADALVAPAREAVEVFGFHLCTLDLRQNSDVHERVVDELLRVGG
jgi:phosphoenolpyruvate carboxylase